MGSGAMLTPRVLLLAVPVLLVALLLSGGSRSSTASLGFLGVLLVIALSTTNAVLEGPYVQVVIRLPSTDELGTVHIEIVDGAIVQSGASVPIAHLSIDMCDDDPETNSFIIAESLWITNTSTICADGSISIDGFVQAGTEVAVSINSRNSSVSLSSSYLGGAYKMSSGSGSLSQPDGLCSVTNSNSTYREGTCSPFVAAHTLEIIAATSATLAVKAGCATTFVNDPAMGANIPSSPTVNPATTAIRSLNQAKDWQGWIAWGNGQTVVNNVAPNSVDLNITAEWVNSAAWLVGLQDLTLPAGGSSSFTFSMLRGPTAPNIVNASVILIGKVPVLYNVQPNQFPSTDPNVYFTYDIPGPILNQTVSFNFDHPGVDLGTARLLIRVTFPQQRPLWSMRFYDLKLTTNIAVPSSLQTGVSERVEDEIMPAGLDAQNSATCPHTQSGLSHWHNPSIWPGGVMPNPSGSISIPEGLSVLVSSCSLDKNAVYQRIHVPSTSKLIFSDANQKIRASNIYVQGELHMGASQCRLNSKIEIEFVGAKTAADNIAPGLGSKGIGVGMSGSIDIHGRQYHPSWTRLAANVWPGADTIYLQAANNWEVGQSIVIATSAYKDMVNDQNEVRVIKAIDQSGKRIQVTVPFTFYHFAGPEYQTEVGLLSRRIVLKGDAQSETQQFGGHTRVTGNGRFSGVQTYRMGQRNVLGKYPFHFHAMGPSPTSFIKDCSIWQSYFRCIAIHSTNETQILRNVVFNATAHCYYLEDGVEEKNVINYNLAVKINTIHGPMGGESQTGDKLESNSTLILPADGAAAGFYITNAYNTFIGNAASGGWAGFSFPNLPEPIGISRGIRMVPQKPPTKNIRGNTAHKKCYNFPGGGCIYVGGLLKYKAADSNVLWYDDGRYSRNTVSSTNVAQWMQFNETKVWMCGMGISHWGDRVEIIGFESYDTGRSVQVFGEAWFSDAIVSTGSSNAINFPSGQSGFQFYDTYVKSIVTDVIFRGFHANNPPYDPSSDTNPFSWPDKRVLTSLIHSDYFKPQGISATRALVFEDVDRSQYFGHKKINTGSSRYTNFVDWDGSFGGSSASPQILGSGIGWWKYSTECVYENDWFMWRCPQEGRQIVNIDYRIPGTIDSGTGDTSATSVSIGTTHLFGPGLAAGLNATLTRNPGVTGIGKLGWYFHHNQGSPRVFSAYQYLNPLGQYVIGAWKYAAGTTFSIKVKYDWAGSTTPVSSVNNFNDLLNGDGLKYYFDDKHLYIKMKQTLDSLASRNYTRGGVTIWTISQPIHYDVTVTCANPSGEWCPSTYVHPTAWV
jgi:hypothetical protein